MLGTVACPTMSAIGDKPREIRMRAIRRASFAVLAFVLSVGLGVGTAGARQAPPGAPSAVHASPLYSVTLVTGDRVSVFREPGGRVTTGVTPGPGRDGVSFFKRGNGTDIEVLPSDALPLVQAGVLDRRLFEVGALAKQGLDDAHTGELALIVAGHAGMAPAVRTVRSLAGVGTAVRAPKSDAPAVWQAVTAGSTGHVWLDGRSRVTDADSNAQIGVPAARSRGLTGQGVTVAVLDTGVDATHPDLANVADSKDFTNAPDGTVDDYGHGTHVASILAGSGAASAGQYAGVAPGARLIVGKVCDQTGNCDDSAVIAGMQWAAAQGARVVNLSLGSPFGDGTDPVSVAVNQLTASTGTLFVCAAGNDGEQFSVGSPGVADAALSVGSVSRQDTLSDFSSFGPRTGDDAVKPDILAPGEDIVAARATGTSLGTPVGTQYTTLSGTSMATPHVAGVAALLAQEHPDWRATQLKAALMGSADPLPGVDVFHGGTGRVDADTASSATVYPVTASANFGLQRFPYANDAASTRTATYRNDGAVDVTLHLGLSTVDSAGQPGPAGLLDVSPSTVTVPAHGTADVTVTLTPSRATHGYQLSGRLTATGDGVPAVQMAFGAYFEPESYDVTVKAVDRDGKPASGDQYVDVVDGLGDDHLVTLTGGTGTVRLPKTRVDVVAFIRTGTSRTAVYVPAQTLDHNLSVTLDARKGKRISFATDRSDAVPVDLVVDLVPLNTFEGVDQSILVSGTAPVYAVPVTGPTKGEFAFVLRAELSSPAKASKPYGYHLVYAFADRIPSSLSFAPHDSALGTVTTTYAAQGTAATGRRLLAGAPGSVQLGGFGLFHDIPLPYHVTDHYTATPSTWQQFVEQRAAGQTTQPPADGSVIGPVTGYAAGKTVTETWNRAVLGTTLHPQGGLGDSVNRFADNLTVALWPWSPAEPGHTADPFQETDYVAGSTTLAANGTTLASNPQVGLLDAFGLPEAKTAYTLTVTGTRSPGWSTLATSVTDVWQFSSAYLDPFTTVYLPLLTVRATGSFDDLDRAPAGTTFPLSLSVETQPGASASTVRTVTVQYSTDDGRTWKSASVSGSGTSRKVSIPNPRTGFVSLRLSATDAAGDRVDQTVIRAYAVK